MKILIMATLIVVTGLVVFSFLSTGEVGLRPSRRSSEEIRLRTLEKQLERARQQVAQARRATGKVGADASTAVAAAQREAERLARELESVLADLRRSAQEQAVEARAGAHRRLEQARTRARERAEKLQRALQAFQRELQ